MNFRAGYRLGGLAVALSLGLATIGVANAQQGQPPAGTGILVGEVDKCVNGSETPMTGVNVGVAGGNPNMDRTDNNGYFLLTLAPGQYTIQASADDGTTAARPYVPVQSGTSLDIGVLELAGGCAGNDIGSAAAPAPAQATTQPTAQPTVAATPTTAPPAPTPTVAQPTATAVPAPDQSAPTDQSSPSDEPQPDDNSDAG